MLSRAFLFAVCLTTTAFAATKPDFSGSYAGRQKKSNTATTASLRVVQTQASVEVTRIYGAHSITNNFPLDGTEGDYTTETGARGKCRAKLKNSTLILESLVASSPKGNAPSVRFVTVEEWRLSADTKTLTIKTDIKSPDIPADVMSLAFPNNPETEKYQRVEPQ